MSPATQELVLERIDSARRLVEQGYAVLPADALREVSAMLHAEAARDLQGAIERDRAEAAPC